MEPDNTVQAAFDASSQPYLYDYPEVDFTVGVLNSSSAPVSSVIVNGSITNKYSEFRPGNGVCAYRFLNCNYGPTGYEGPGTSFVTSASLPDSVEVDFSPALAAGATTFFSLPNYDPHTYYGMSASLGRLASGDPSGQRRKALGVGGANSATNVGVCNQTPQPVTCSSGDFWHTITDAAVAGRGGGLVVSRTYNSLLAGVAGPFGFGWSASFASSVSLDTAGNATLVEGNGAQLTFAALSGGGFMPAAGEFASLTQSADGTFTAVVRARQVLTFNVAGQLTATSDLDGDTVSYGHDSSGQLASITDGGGRSLTFAYANGLVSSVTDPLGRVTSYGYDGSGNMTSSTDPSGRVRHYSYDANHLMTSMTDPNGGVLTNTFDGSGRTVTQTDAMGRETAFAYAGDNFSPLGGSTTITDPAGLVTVENYSGGALVSLTKGFGTPAAATWTYSVDPVTAETLGVTDPNGFTSSRTFDANGNTTSITDADGRTTSFTYDGLNDVTSKTDAAGVTTTFTYTSTGDLVNSTVPLGSGTVTASNTYGNPAHPGDVTSSTDGNGQVTSFGYDSNGDVVSVTDPDGNVSTATFDADGEKLASVTADGNVSGCGCAAANASTYTYTPGGQLHSTTDPLGGVTTYGYDGDGNTTSVTDPTGLTTTSVFDADNELTRTTQPDGTYVSYGYDADGRRVSVANGTDPAAVSTYDALGDVRSVTDPMGNKTVDTYDVAGRLTKSQAPDGGVTSYVYDSAGQLLATTSPTGGVTTDSYDADGRITTATDADHNTTTYSYDTLGRPTTTTRADGTTTVNGYDNVGDLTSYTDGAGHATTYVFDPARRETSSADPDGRITRFGYDASGNQTAATDALGRVATNTFDADGRLTKTVYTGTGTPSAAYSYDAAGRRVTMVDGTGTTTDAYDRFGRLASVTDGAGDKVAYSYDALGRIAALTYPDGHVVTSGYDANDRTTSVTDWTNNTTTFGYNGDGNLTTTAYPNGVVDTTTVNAADQPTAVTINHGPTSLASFGYTPDPAGQVSASTDSLAPSLSTTYSYTALNQLARPANASTAYRYDAAGNLTGLASGATMTYDQAGQLQTVTPPTGQPTTFGFDGVGDRTSQTGAPVAAGAGCGICVLAATGSGTLTASGTASIKSSGVITANSTSVTAITGSGSATIAGSHTYAGGGAKTTGTATITPAAVVGTTPDPLASAAPPVVGGTATALTVTGSNSATAKPGVYSAITVSGAAHLTLTPGDYVLTGAGLTVSGSATVNATGVTIYLTCATYPTGCTAGTSGAGLSVTGAAQLTVNGPADTDGIAIFADRNNTAALTVSGSAPATITGHVYAPAATLWVTGNATLSVAGTIAAAQVGVSGSAKLADTASASTASNVTFTYNVARELTASTTATGTTTYSYDGDGLRATSTSGAGITKYAWNTDTGIPQLLADSTNDYLYGPNGNVLEQVNRTTGAAIYLHPDQIGSTRVLTNSAGATVATTSFDPYGNLIARSGSAATPFGYTGQYTDPTGIIYLRARYYDPATGQLLTIDPLVDTTRQAYAYVAGDPLNASDPTGLLGPPCLTCSFHIVTGFLGAAWSATVSSAKCAIPATAGLCLQQLSNTYDANRNIGLSPLYSAIATLDPAVSGYSGTSAAIAAFKQGCWTQGGSDSFTGAAGFAGTIGIGIGVGEGVAALTDILAATEAGSATVEAGKWDYLFGRVASNAHNAARSAENASQLARLGVYDNAEGRALLQAHFDELLSSDSNIMSTYTNKYGTFQVRDSLFSGPGGFARFETTWQVTGSGYRLTTLIPFGGG